LTRNGSVSNTLTINLLLTMIIPFTKNGIALYFGCKLCSSQIIKKIECNGPNARWPHRVRAGLAFDACATSRARAEERRSLRSSVWPHSIAQDLDRPVPGMQFVGNARCPSARFHSIELIRSAR